MDAVSNNRFKFSLQVGCKFLVGVRELVVVAVAAAIIQIDLCHRGSLNAYHKSTVSLHNSGLLSVISSMKCDKAFDDKWKSEAA